MAYIDPRPGLPLSPLMQRGAAASRPVTKLDVTEIRKLVTEIPVAKKKRGKPAKAGALTSAQRVAAHRAAKKLGVTVA